MRFSLEWEHNKSRRLFIEALDFKRLRSAFDSYNGTMTLEELEAGLDSIRQSPKEAGALALIVRRPQVGEREVLEAAELNLTRGLVGDNWETRGTPDPEMQLNVMNVRAVALLAQQKERWPLAGDQLYIDLDLSAANLPPGTRLTIGSAIIEVTAKPHLGCKKFAARFGQDAVKWVNSSVGKELKLRGINAKVVRAGVIHVGDAVRKASM